MSFKAWTLMAAAAFGLSACGDTGTDQALIGGAAGAGIAVITDGSPLKGAAIGAAGNFLYCQTYPSKCN